jgi:hypothetical protein
MKNPVAYKTRWALASALLRLNPSASYARIARATGYTGQMVGVIAKELKLPPRTAGGFNKKDETDLIYPTNEVLAKLYGEYDEYKMKQVRSDNWNSNMIDSNPSDDSIKN